MKSYTFLILSLFTLQSVFSQTWDGTIARGFGGGTGTEDDPYLITSPQELAYLATKTNAGGVNHFASTYFELTNDIDLGGLPWPRIGTGSPNWHMFSGNFEGNNHAIYNLNINEIELDYVGLFGYLLSARVANLSVEGNNSIIAGGWVGGIVGSAKSSVIYNCQYHGSISGINHIGGIAGRLSDAAIINSCNTSGEFTIRLESTERGHSGGIVGQLFNSTASECYFNGKIFNYSNYGSAVSCGGIAGFIQGEGSIVFSCYNNGEIYAPNMPYVGGIGGYGGEGPSISNCYNTGTITGMSSVGGIAGAFQLIEYSYNVGDIVGEDLISGILGESLFDPPENTPVSNCYYSKGGGNYGNELTDEEMKQGGFIDMLNFGQPVEWKADYQNQINSGYPILLWQEEQIVDNMRLNKTINSEIEIYPNPLEGEYIHINSEVQQGGDMIIYDINGRILVYRNNLSSTEVVGRNQFTKGIYFIQIISNKTNQIKKIIVK